MIYSFVFNRVGYPQCFAEAPYQLLGQFLSFELVSTRLKEIEQVLASGGDIDIEVERDDAILTIYSNGEVEIDIFGEGDEGGGSIKLTLVEFKTAFYEWKNFLENCWNNYGSQNYWCCNWKLIGTIPLRKYLVKLDECILSRNSNESEIQLLRARMSLQTIVGENQYQVGNGLTLNTGGVSGNKYGVVETINFERS